jgi:type II secretory ATPase GspE/PulE/Tfp pilus assembly ATPase PilB-like protein
VIEKEEVGVALTQELRLDVAYGNSVLSFDPEALKYIPVGFASRHDVFPYGIDGPDLLVAVADTEESTIDRIRLITGMRVRPTVAARETLRASIAAAYGVASGANVREERSSLAPVVRLVDDIHSDAVRAGASDVHVEPWDRGGRVRQRVDGRLVEARFLDGEVYAQVVARIKLLGALDVADRRQPQDGRYAFESRNGLVDVRLSSLATCDGERLVLRLFDSTRQRPKLADLGMDAQTLKRCRRLIHAAHGFIVVCGPTGSGKTTTLYAALDERRSEREHLCTIEDPIEMHMSGVAQVQVNTRAGMTFPGALRAVLRQDPDVVMIGEMRDCETASVAASAALAGQLVLATMHSFDAPSAVARLVDLGVARHAIAAALTGVLTQRLVRTCCSTCSGKGGSCAGCAGTGFSGRTGIFACVEVAPELRDAIAQGASTDQLARLVERTSGASLARDGLRHVMQGRTSAAEVQRVLGAHAEE